MNTHLCSRACDAHDDLMWLQLHGLQCLVTVSVAVIAVVGGCAAAVAAAVAAAAAVVAAVVAAVAHTVLFTTTRNVHDVVGPCVVVLVKLTVCVARNLLLVLWLFMMWLQLPNL